MSNKFSLVKIDNFIMFFISLGFIVLGNIKFFILHDFTIIQFIVVELFFIICGAVSFLFLLDKVSSVRDIARNKSYRVGDYFLAAFSFIFGGIGLFVSFYWISDGISKIISIVGSTFFILGSIVVIFLEFKKTRGRFGGFDK